MSFLAAITPMIAYIEEMVMDNFVPHPWCEK